MAELMSRCLALAEGVVTMVCPVLLALVLKKINWKDKVDNEPVVPMSMLLIAGASLLTGICPLLFSLVSDILSISFSPYVTSVPAHLSSIYLMVLACFISYLILPSNLVVLIGVIIVPFTIVVLVILHSSASALQTETAAASGTAQADADERRKEIQDILDKTHEFMSGITGILFLGLEVLALEGLISTYHGIPYAFQTPVMLSLLFCAIGAFLMSLTMTYPLTDTTRKASVVSLTLCFDLLMFGGTVAILTTIMVKLMGTKGFLPITFPILIIFDRVYRVAIRSVDAPGTQQSQTLLPTSTGSTPPSSQGTVQQEQAEQQVQAVKAAPLGLTKVTFAGFWAMSVTTISTGSHNDWFLVVAAAAITSGLSWRLLTHRKNEDMVKTANTASFCTHINIAVATVLFTVMAYERQPINGK